MRLRATGKLTHAKTKPLANNSSKAVPTLPPKRRTQVKSKIDPPTKARIERGTRAVGPRPGSKTAEGSRLAQETSRGRTQGIAKGYWLAAAFDSWFSQRNRGQENGLEGQLDQNGIRGTSICREGLILQHFLLALQPGKSVHGRAVTHPAARLRSQRRRGLRIGS